VGGSSFRSAGSSLMSSLVGAFESRPMVVSRPAVVSHPAVVSRPNPSVPSQSQCPVPVPRPSPSAPSQSPVPVPEPSPSLGVPSQSGRPVPVPGPVPAPWGGSTTLVGQLPSETKCPDPPDNLFPRLAVNPAIGESVPSQSRSPVPAVASQAAPGATSPLGRGSPSRGALRSLHP
jgi:hypothetical protein